MLEGATSELWAYQKIAAERASDGNEGTTDDAGVTDLCAAIAKVQFVQVYLRDPSLQLSDDITQESNTVDAPSHTTAEIGVQESSSGRKSSSIQPRTIPDQPRIQIDDLADPSSFEDAAVPPDGDSSKRIASSGSDSASVQPQTTPARQTENSAKLARPSLEQSPFSWMLEEQKPQSSSAKGQTFSSGRGKSKGFLFGDETQ